MLTILVDYGENCSRKAIISLPFIFNSLALEFLLKNRKLSKLCQKFYLLWWHNALCFSVPKNYAGMIDTSLHAMTDDKHKCCLNIIEYNGIFHNYGYSIQQTVSIHTQMQPFLLHFVLICNYTTLYVGLVHSKNFTHNS